MRVYCGLAQPNRRRGVRRQRFGDRGGGDDAGRLLDLCDLTMTVRVCGLGGLLASDPRPADRRRVAADNREHEVTLLLAGRSVRWPSRMTNRKANSADRFADDYPVTKYRRHS